MKINRNTFDPNEEVATKNLATHDGPKAGEPPAALRETSSPGGESAASGADHREKNLHGAIVVGVVLILALAAAVYYLRYLASYEPAQGYSNLEIETTPNR
jgi:hypothetical protein